MRVSLYISANSSGPVILAHIFWHSTMQQFNGSLHKLKVFLRKLIVIPVVLDIAHSRLLHLDRIETICSVIRCKMCSRSFDMVPLGCCDCRRANNKRAIGGGQ